MVYHAIIDTNVIISSLLKKNSIPDRIVDQALFGKIIPMFDNKTLAEYEDVLNRKKFTFPQETIENLLNGIISRGKYIDAKDFEDDLPDPTDKIFYWVTLTAREEVETYLVTGNLKHFPIKPFIVTPREMLEILESDSDC